MTLISFWLAAGLLVVTLIGAAGWFVAFCVARWAWDDGRAREASWRAYRLQGQRLSELRFLNKRLVSRVRDVEPKRSL